MMAGRNIVPLEESDITVVARLAAVSFEYDPSFAWFFPPAADREQRIGFFCRFMVTRTIRAGDPALGIRDSQGRLVAFALAEDRCGFFQRDVHRLIIDLGLYRSFLRNIGRRALKRMALYFRVSRRHRKRSQSLYLVMIGVHPDARGQGYGRQLIEHLRRWDMGRRCAGGMGLDTENPANSALYKHLGFELCTEETLDEMRIFVFHCPYGRVT